MGSIPIGVDSFRALNLFLSFEVTMNENLMRLEWEPARSGLREDADCARVVACKVSVRGWST